MRGDPARGQPRADLGGGGEQPFARTAASAASLTPRRAARASSGPSASHHSRAIQSGTE